jgi:Domain of unknown function (DUF4844)
MFSNFLKTIYFVLAALFALGFVLFWQSEQQLVISSQVINELKTLRAEPKFLDLPGASAEQERRRFEPLFNELLDQLNKELPQNPKKSLVIKSMDPLVEKFHLEDTEVRERCVIYIERILKVLDISNVNRAFWKYFIFI